MVTEPDVALLAAQECLAAPVIERQYWRNTVCALLDALILPLDVNISLLPYLGEIDADARVTYWANRAPGTLPSDI